MGYKRPVVKKGVVCFFLVFVCLFVFFESFLLFLCGLWLYKGLTSGHNEEVS